MVPLSLVTSLGSFIYHTICFFLCFVFPPTHSCKWSQQTHSLHPHNYIQLPVWTHTAGIKPVVPWRSVYLPGVIVRLHFQLTHNHHYCVSPGTIAKHGDLHLCVSRSRDAAPSALTTEPLLIRNPTVLLPTPPPPPHARCSQTQFEEQKNRSEKLGNTQIVVIQFAAGRTHSCFSRQPLSLSAQWKQAFSRLTVTSSVAFIILSPPRFHGGKLFHFIFN